MNPYLILAGVVMWIASVTAGFVYGKHVEADHKDAMAAREQQVAQVASQAAAASAAEAISQIKVVNTTIQAKVMHEIETHTVYRDCEHTPDGLRYVNAALTGSRQVPPDLVMPAADAASGPVVRLDGEQAR
jgi:hypothetical protein